MITRGCFITGTGTGVGKTVLTAAVVAALRARGLGVRGLKPVMTGLDEAADPDWPHDHELLARVGGRPPDEVASFTFAPAVSPHLAAQLAGVELRLDEVAQAVRARVQGAEVAVVEGVGGLLVPLGPGFDVADLAAELALPLVLAASPGLGTINHTLLTLEAARTRGLQVAGVVLTPWPQQPGLIERSNRETIAELGGVEVSTLPHLRAGEAGLLAKAGGLLPLEGWLGELR